MIDFRILGFVPAAMAAVVLAAPAQADPALLNGTYQGNDQQFAWTIATGCTVSGCTGTVSSNQGWVSPMTPNGGQWDFAVIKPDGAICDDGNYAPTVIRVSLDPVSLGGVVTNSSNGECPGSVVTANPFQLRRIG